MSEEEAKQYLRKKLPKYFIAVGILFGFGATSIILATVFKNYTAGMLLILAIGIPSAITCIIWLLLVGRKYNKIMAS